MNAPGPARLIGRYLLFGEIASGGMATVHFGRLSGVAGFSRTVAIKRLHPQYAQDPEFLAMFLDEARLAARIRHPNVVPTLDVVANDGEVFLVMEYVQGESLAKLLRAVRGMMTATDTRVVATIIAGVLHGLHAAHEAVSEQGEPLNIVHRDVSPQNILVGVDGVARLLDFGVARAVGRLQTTRAGQLKGKIAYMAPEQLHNLPVTRQSDIYSASVVAWEALTGQRLFVGDNEAAVVTAVLQLAVRPPSQVAPHVPLAIDRVVMRGLARDPARRYASAREMALDLERSAGVAPGSEVGTWVESLARDELSRRAIRIAEIESATSSVNSHRTTIPQADDLPTIVSGLYSMKSASGTPQSRNVGLPGSPQSNNVGLPGSPQSNNVGLPGSPQSNNVGLPGSPQSNNVALSSGPHLPDLLTEEPSIVVSPPVAPPIIAKLERDRGRPLIFWAVVGAAAMAASLSTIAILHYARKDPPALTPSPPPAPEPSLTAALSPAAAPTLGPPPTPSTAPESGDAINVLLLPRASPSSAPSAPVRPHRRYAPSPPAHAPAAAPSPPPPTTSCDPPYTIDDVGHKHYKPACL